jgi:hypothetical protein
MIHIREPLSKAFEDIAASLQRNLIFAAWSSAQYADTDELSHAYSISVNSNQ